MNLCAYMNKYRATMPYIIACPMSSFCQVTIHICRRPTTTRASYYVDRNFQYIVQRTMLSTCTRCAEVPSYRHILCRIGMPWLQSLISSACSYKSLTHYHIFHYISSHNIVRDKHLSIRLRRAFSLRRI